MENRNYNLDAINNEDLPNVIASTFVDIDGIDEKIKDSIAQGEKAEYSANVAYNKSAGWSFDGSKKEKAIEALQEASLEQSKALTASIDASRVMFEYQRKLANSIFICFGRNESCCK